MPPTVMSSGADQRARLQGWCLGGGKTLDSVRSRVPAPVWDERHHKGVTLNVLGGILWVIAALLPYNAQREANEDFINQLVGATSVRRRPYSASAASHAPWHDPRGRGHSDWTDDRRRGQNTVRQISPSMHPKSVSDQSPPVSTVKST
jgi:hypothetical protein